MEEVTLKLNKDLIQVNIQAIDIAVKAVGLNGAEALVVLAKTISEQTGETVLLQSSQKLKRFR